MVRTFLTLLDIALLKLHSSSFNTLSLFNKYQRWRLYNKEANSYALVLFPLDLQLIKCPLFFQGPAVTDGFSDLYNIFPVTVWLVLVCRLLAP